jgi:hypothetical protein
MFISLCYALRLTLFWIFSAPFSLEFCPAASGIGALLTGNYHIWWESAYIVGLFSVGRAGMFYPSHLHDFRTNLHFL